MRPKWIALFVISLALLFAVAFSLGFQVGERHVRAAAPTASTPVAAADDQVSIAECEARMDAVGQSGIAALNADHAYGLKAMDRVNARCEQSIREVGAHCREKMDALDALWRRDFTALARQKERPLPSSN